jgi:hypothetical protein
MPPGARSATARHRTQGHFRDQRRHASSLATMAGLATSNTMTSSPGAVPEAALPEVAGLHLAMPRARVRRAADSTGIVRRRRAAAVKKRGCCGGSPLQANSGDAVSALAPLWSVLAVAVGCACSVAHLRGLDDLG